MNHSTKVKGQYALIVYQETAKSRMKRGEAKPNFLYDIVELTVISKKHRIIGDRSRVTWVDKKTNKKSSHYVVVKQISENRDELMKVIIDATSGEVVAENVKAFTKETIQKQKDIRGEKKTDLVATKSAAQDLEKEIAEDVGIYSINANANSTQSAPFSPSTIMPVVEKDSDVVGPLDETKFWSMMQDLRAIATPENIALLESVVQAFKSCTLTKPSSAMANKTVNKVADLYKEPGKEKIPIFNGVNFFLYSGVKVAIEQKSYIFNKESRVREKSWRHLIRFCLTEVYGGRLHELSAKGTKQGHRPAIDYDLYKGLLYWAREWSGEELEEDDYVAFINKTAYNKRKALKQRKEQETSGDTITKAQKEKNSESSTQGKKIEKSQEQAQRTTQHLEKCISTTVNAVQPPHAVSDIEGSFYSYCGPQAYYPHSYYPTQTSAHPSNFECAFTTPQRDENSYPSCSTYTPL